MPITSKYDFDHRLCTINLHLGEDAAWSRRNGSLRCRGWRKAQASRIPPGPWRNLPVAMVGCSGTNRCCRAQSVTNQVPGTLEKNAAVCLWTVAARNHALGGIHEDPPLDLHRCCRTLRSLVRDRCIPLLHDAHDPIYNKPRPDAFSDPGLESYLKQRRVGTIFVTGSAAEACVYATAWGARNRGYRVIVIDEATYAFYPKKKEETFTKYRRLGVEVVTLGELRETIAGTVRPQG